METVLTFLALGILIIGGLFSRSNRVWAKVLGVFLSAPPISLIIAWIANFVKDFAKDYLVYPDAQGKLTEWLGYGFNLGMVPFIAALVLVIAINFLASYFLGSGNYVATPNALGGYDIRENDSSFGWRCLPYTIYLLAVLPYGLIDGVTQWLLYRFSWHNELLIWVIPVIVLTIIIWVVGMLGIIFAALRNK